MATNNFQERRSIYRSLHAHMAAMDEQEGGDIFIWDPRLETGIPKLDGQHQKLAQLINVLGRMLSADLEQEIFERSMFRIFDELAAYVDYHFRFKENMMERYQCDKEHHGLHINAHAEFIRELNQARISGQDNPHAAAGRILVFLPRWLVKHIFETDMRMAKFIQLVQAGATPEQAARHADEFMKNYPDTMRHAMGSLYASMSNRTQALLDSRRARDLNIGTGRQSGPTSYKH